MKKIRNKCCLIYNFPQHYRKAIFTEMDRRLGFDFYFGDQLYWAPDVKSFDVHELRGFKEIFKNLKIYKYVWQKGAVKTAFKKYDHYILYGDPGYISSWVIMIICRILGKKTYLWMHGFKQQELSWKEKILSYPFISLSNKLLLYGNYSKEIMIKNGIPEYKLECIYNSLDYYLQLKVRDQLNETNIFSNHFCNNLPVLIYIGRIQKSKKIDMILDAMVLLEQRGVNINLVIVGEDREGVNLIQNLEEKLLKHLWLYGPCYDENIIGELMFNANICVSPGNVGLTAIHSLMYGTPVITHSNFKNQGPEFESIQVGITGDFFEENNVEDLSIKIFNWLSLNKEKREIIRNECYSVVDDKYNPNFQIEILKKVLNIEELNNNP